MPKSYSEVETMKWSVSATENGEHVQPDLKTAKVLNSFFKSIVKNLKIRKFQIFVLLYLKSKTQP